MLKFLFQRKNKINPEAQVDSRTLAELDKNTTAIHEAAHAYIMDKLYILQSTSVIPDHFNLGSTTSQLNAGHPYPAAFLKQYMQVLWAGPIAETLLEREISENTWDQDMLEIGRLGYAVISDEKGLINVNQIPLGHILDGKFLHQMSAKTTHSLEETVIEEILKQHDNAEACIKPAIQVIRLLAIQLAIRDTLYQTDVRATVEQYEAPKGTVYTEYLAA